MFFTNIFGCFKKQIDNVQTINTSENYQIVNQVAKDDNITEDGLYTSKDDVAKYIYKYKKLPSNYITKKQARKLGWSSGVDLNKIAPGKSIGGDIFNNYEKKLPIIKHRKYYECDIDYKNGNRNSKRIIYADDFDEDIGFIYWTEDHYETFERLY